MKELMKVIEDYSKEHGPSLFTGRLCNISDKLNRFFPENFTLSDLENFKIISKYDYSYTQTYIDQELLPSYNKTISDLQEQIQTLKNVISYKEVERVKELMDKGVVKF